MAQTLGSMLMERAKAGVRVLVLYDAFGTVDIPAKQRDALRMAGVRVEPFRPIRLSTLHLAQNRSHVRGIVIDSRIGWTGGAYDTACQDVRRRWSVVNDRLDEFRQSIDGSQRRGDADGARPCDWGRDEPGLPERSRRMLTRLHLRRFVGDRGSSELLKGWSA
jgi:phosphatidylserine/phosphatidylglycerophosphate/cardiolipin synthase-like enzyme